MFYDCSSLLSLPDISKWNINNLNGMSFMFYKCRSIKSVPDLTKWNTSNVKYYAYCMCIKYQIKIPFSCMNYDTIFENISNKYIMIYEIKDYDDTLQILANKFVDKNAKEGIIIINNQKYHLVEELPIEKTNKDKLIIEMELSINVHNLSYMFADCRSLLEFREYNEISEINNKLNNNDEKYFEIEENKDYFKGQDENNFYYYDENDDNSIKIQNKFSNNQIYGYNTDNSTIKNMVDNIALYENRYTNMSFMFYNCESLISLPDISKWNTGNVNNMSYMFYNCSSLISLPDISKLNTDNVNDMSYMFYNCKSLISLTDYN